MTWTNRRTGKTLLLLLITCIVFLSLISNLFLGSYSYNTLRKSYLKTDQEKCSQANEIERIENFDTTIVINTSLIKTHPSLEMFNATFDSLRYLHGLPPKTPIVITIDGLLSEKRYKYKPNDNKENKMKLQEYVRRLRLKFKNDKHVTILHSYESGLLTVNLKMAMEHVETKYVFVIQHDLRFIHDVNYTALLRSMEENPDTLNIVRFHQRKNIVASAFKMLKEPEGKKNCTSIFRDEKNGLEFVPQVFSDQNHLTTTKYYKWMLDMMGDSPRFMETVMLNAIAKYPTECRTFGQWLYGPPGSGPYIEHMDGQRSNGLSPTNSSSILLNRTIAPF